MVFFNRSKINRKAIWLVAVLALVVTGSLAAIQFTTPFSSPPKQAQPTLSPIPGQLRLVVVGDQLFPPYEYLEDGQPTGFNVELLQAVADTMGMSLDIRLLPWNDARQAIESGQADVITGMFYSPERDKLVDFSVPHSFVSSGLFVRNDSDIQNIEDLQGKAVVVQEGDIMNDYLQEQNFEGDIYLVAEPIEGLRLLASGRYDAVLLSSRLQGQYYIDRFHLTNLRVLDTGMPPRPYAFAVSEGDQDLVARLNEGLNILKATGRYQKITEKWFSVYQESRFSRFLPYLLVGSGVLSLLLVGALLWTRLLQVEVNKQTRQLAASEKKYADLINNANEGIAVVQDRQIIFINPEGRNILGLTSEQNPPIPIDIFTPEIQNSPDQGQPSNILRGQELIIQSVSNHSLTLEISTTAIEWQGVDSTLVFFVDRTQRHQFEKALQEKEEHFRLLFNEAPLSYQSLDENGCFLTVNETWLNILGYERDEVIGHCFSEFLVPEEAELFQMRFPMFKKAGEIHDIEFHIQRKDGQVLTVSYDGRISHNLDGSFRQTHCIFEDVTEKRKALDALRDSEERFRRMFEDSILGVFQTNQSGEIQIVNRAFAQMHGFSSTDEIIRKINQPASQLEPNDLSTQWQQIINTVTGIQGAFTRQLSIKKSNGHGFIGEIHAWPVYDKGDHIRHIEGFVEDVTDKIKYRETIEDLAKFPHEDPNPVLRVNQAGKILYANPASSCLLESWHTQIGEMLPQYLQKVTLEVYSTRSIKILNQSCAERTFSITFAPITDQKYINLYATDITETLSYLEELKSSESKFSTAFLLSPDSMIISRIEDGLLIDTNESFLRLTGYRLEEIIGKKSSEIKLWHDPEQRKEVIAHVQKSGSINDYEVQLHLKDGSIRTGLFSACIITINGQKRLLSIFHDIHQRKINEERIRRSLDQLNALRSIDMFISASTDLQITLNAILEHVINQLQVDAAAIQLVNTANGLVELAAESGLSLSYQHKKSIPLSQSLACQAVQERSTNHLSSPPNPPIHIEENTFLDYFAVPLVAKGQILGVLELYNRSVKQIDTDWLQFLEALAGQSAIAIENANMFEHLEVKNLQLVRAYTSVIEGWARALELRDGETEGHSERVVGLTLTIARMMNVPEEELTSIRFGALLHDIGKMGIPDHILLKPGPLTPEEWEIMRHHPQYASDLLASIDFYQRISDIPFYHHERWDGSGYPQGLKGNEIPLAARIFSVVDVWDALTSDRPYRRAWSKEEARKYIQQNAGVQFDPIVVTHFLTLV